MKTRALAAVLAASLFAFAAHAELHGDLHGGVSAGMAAGELPKTGYKDFACVDPKDAKPANFDDFKLCAADPQGLREMRVAIDEPGQDETLVAGHPVDLTLGFDASGRLMRIDIVTKSKGPMFLRKKAFLLGLQAKSRYGEDGWDCQEAPLGSDEEALGPTSVKEHCVKTAGDRRIAIDRSLFRKVGADARAFTSQSRVTIDFVSH